MFSPNGLGSMIKLPVLSQSFNLAQKTYKAIGPEPKLHSSK